MVDLLSPFVAMLSRNDPSTFSLRSARSAKHASLSPLPLEIMVSILEAAYFIEDDMEPDTQLLSACALVCRAWTMPSQSLLFRRVTLRTTSSFRAFISAVSLQTDRSRALSNAVVCIKAVIDHQHPDQLSHRALALAVTSCPSLYELDLSVYGCHVVEQQLGPNGESRIFRAAPSFDDGILSMLRSGPQIRSLKLANWSDNGEISFQLLANVWPALEYLALRGKAPCLPIADDRLIVPFNSALQSLRLGISNLTHTDFLKWLMANSRHSLRSLELESNSGPGGSALAAVLQQCGRHLESVSLASCTTRDQATALRACSSLKEFKVENSATSPLLHALEELPKTVVHIAFTLGYDTPVYLMTNFVKARRGLKAITMHVWKGGESHKELPALRMACAWQGVKLTVLRDVGGFRECVRGDPLPTSCFPRTKNTLNLTRMLVASWSSLAPPESRQIPCFDRQREVEQALSGPYHECTIADSNASRTNGRKT